MTDSTCLVDDCPRAVAKRGWCGMHYARWYRTGTTELIEHTRADQRICLIGDCPKPQAKRGWCGMHYARWRRTGTTDLIEYARQKNQPCMVGDCPRMARSFGLCRAHYRRLYETGDIQAETPLRRIRQDTILKDIAPLDLAWLAGWMEGEGCFSGHNNQGYTAFRITGNSTDRDVVEHLLELTGVGSISDRERTPPEKHIWIWSVCARQDVTALATLLLPFMHKRRGDRIRQLLDWDGPGRPWTPVPPVPIDWINA